jgi:hypothetical protein
MLSAIGGVGVGTAKTRSNEKNKENKERGGNG